MQSETYYLVSNRVLPESIAKTAAAKKLLTSGEAETVQQAVEQVGISRSVYYKYKDGIYPSHTVSRDKLITLSLVLEHRSGVLSEVLTRLASGGGNILTIHQTIPLQGQANVTMSVDTTNVTATVDSFTQRLKGMEGVQKADIIGQS